MNGRLDALPAEVLDAGRVYMTAVVHTHYAWAGLWEVAAVVAKEGKPTWPAESGGQATLEKILAQCAEMRESELAIRHGSTEAALADLCALMAPEHKRQRREMAEAIKRVGALVYDTAKRTC